MTRSNDIADGEGRNHVKCKLVAEPDVFVAVPCRREFKYRFGARFGPVQKFPTLVSSIPAACIFLFSCPHRLSSPFKRFSRVSVSPDERRHKRTV